MKINVIGAGAWGTAVANLLSENGNDVALITHENDVIESINRENENKAYLNEFKLSKTLKAKQIQNYENDCELLVNAVPTQYIRHYYTKHHIKCSTPLLNISKGIENSSNFLIHELFELILELPSIKYAVLSGPSHAEETAKQKPTTVVIASKNNSLSVSLQEIFNNNYFRTYTSDDVAGVETGGALKNVIALAAGIIDGINLGDNAKAALITRGLAEIRRIGVAKGANPHTFSGLSGLGDLFVTCNSQLSRNRRVGEYIANGMTLQEITEKHRFVVEGVPTAISARELAIKMNVELPIIEKVNEVLFQGKKPIEAVTDLMTRSSKSESEFMD